MKIFLLFMVLVSLLFTACTKRSKDTKIELENGKEMILPYKETLRIHIVSEPPSLDWHKATDTTSSLITGNTHEGLVSYDITKEEMPLRPALAESWEPNQDSTQWIFKLRKDVKWTDGVAFKGQHVLDAWMRLLSPDTASEYAYFLFAIKNARAFNEGKETDFSKVGVSLKDDYTLVVNLARPMSFFPSLLTHSSTFPVRLDIVEKHGDQWTEAKNIVTLGAFTLKEWKHDELVLLERNENYYGKKPSVKYVLARMVEKYSTAVRLFDSGKLDSVHEVPSKDLRKLRKKPEFTPIQNLLIYYYGFNVDKPPYNNKILRRAISHAIDRDEIVKLLDGGQTALRSWIPKGLLGHDDSIGLRFDLEKSKALIKQAGFDDGSKLPPLVIGFNTNEDHQRIAENVQSQLSRNLGMKVELRNEEWKVYLNTLKSDPYPVFRLGWIADYPDPDNFMNLMTSYSENNRTGWGNQEFDKLIEAAASELDESKRIELYKKAQKLLVEDEVPAMPIYRGVRNHLIAKRIKDYPINPLGYYRFWEVKLK